MYFVITLKVLLKLKVNIETEINLIKMNHSVIVLKHDHNCPLSIVLLIEWFVCCTYYENVMALNCHLED